MTSQTPTRRHSRVIVLLLFGDDKTAGHYPVWLFFSDAFGFMGRNDTDCLFLILQGVPLYYFRFTNLILKFRWVI